MAVLYACGVSTEGTGMITVNVDLPELEYELRSTAQAQHIDIETVVMGALAQCFNNTKLLNKLGFSSRPRSVSTKSIST